MKADFEKILEEAVWAPSGDNVQPWRFKIDQNQIFVFNVPEKDNSLYNRNQGAALIAIGALIENIRIISQSYGYITKPDFFPEDTESDLVAILSLNINQQQKPNPYYSYVKKRTTNRKPYAGRALDFIDKEQLKMIDEALFPDVTIKIVDEREKIETLAKEASQNEKIVLENINLHKFLFTHITWSAKEDSQKKGFFVDTLELSHPARLVFSLCRYWPVLIFLNFLVGISKKVAKQNRTTYTESSAFAAFIAPDLSPMSFVKTGMALQRFWLQATKLKISVHPLTGILFLRHNLIQSAVLSMSESHKSLIHNSYRVISETFGLDNNSLITMMVRVGYSSDGPSARSSRHSPEIVWKS